MHHECGNIDAAQNISDIDVCVHLRKFQSGRWTCREPHVIGEESCLLGIFRDARGYGTDIHVLVPMVFNCVVKLLPLFWSWSPRIVRRPGTFCKSSEENECSRLLWIGGREQHA